MSKSHSSPGQVLQNCYDEPNKALRTTATAIISGSIDVSLDANDGDNVAISDGTNDLAINPDGSINVAGVATETTLSTINNKLNTLGQKAAVASVPVVIASDQSALDVNVLSTSSDTILNDINTNILALPTDNNGLSIGTENGTTGGVQRVFVNNLKEQILSTHDRNAAFSYLDFGTKNQRVEKIEYTSSTIPGYTIRRSFSYTLVGTKYRRDSENWSVI